MIGPSQSSQSRVKYAFKHVTTVGGSRKGRSVCRLLSILAIVCGILTVSVFFIESKTEEYVIPLRVKDTISGAENITSFREDAVPNTFEEQLKRIYQSEAVLRQKVAESRIGMGYNYELDAFGSFVQYQKRSFRKYPLFWDKVKEFLSQCQVQYGVELQVRAMLQRGLSGVMNPLVQLLEHKLNAKNQTLSVLIILQHTAATIDGKEHNEGSPYPSLLLQLLREPMSAIGINLQVHTLTLRNDLQLDHPWSYWCGLLQKGTNLGQPDIVFLDLAATPLEPVSSLHSVLKLAQELFPLSHFIFRGVTTRDIWKSVTRYFDKENAPTLLSHDLAAEPLRKIPIGSREMGFRDWPRYSKQDALSKSEHCLVAWLLGVHLLGAAELVALNDEDDSNATSQLLQKHLAEISGKAHHETPSNQLNRPMPVKGHLFCYTTVSQLHKLSVVGTSDTVAMQRYLPDLKDPPVQIDENIPRGQRWILEQEPQSKRAKTSRQGNEEKAFFGVQKSGVLAFNLSVRTHNAVDMILLCSFKGNGSNGRGCRLENDVTIQVNGVVASTVASRDDSPCVQVRHDSKLIHPVNGTVQVQLSVSTSAVNWLNGPCSVAHLFYTTSEA